MQSFAVSIDGYGAGPGQDLEHSLGIGGEEMFGYRAYYLD